MNQELKQLTTPQHDWDDDGVCKHCMFDGAEWHHWKHHTYEGKASNMKMPPCIEDDGF